MFKFKKKARLEKYISHLESEIVGLEEVVEELAGVLDEVELENEKLEEEIENLKMNLIQEKQESGYLAPYIDSQTGRHYINFYCESGEATFFAVSVDFFPFKDSYMLKVVNPYFDEADYYSMSKEGNLHELKTSEKLLQLFEENEDLIRGLYMEPGDEAGVVV